MRGMFSFVWELMLKKLIHALLRHYKRFSLVDKSVVPQNPPAEEWEDKPRKDGFHRPCGTNLTNRITNIVGKGLPSRVWIVWDKKTDRLKIDFEHLPGWIHLCSNPEIAPWGYHISCGKSRTLDDETWNAWNELYHKWNGTYHLILIKKVRDDTFVMTVSKDDELSKCDLVRIMRTNDKSHGPNLTISA